MGKESFKNNEIIRGFQVTYKNMITGQLIELGDCKGKSEIDYRKDFFFKDGEYITEGYMKSYRNDFLYKISAKTNSGNSIETIKAGSWSIHKTQHKLGIKPVKGHVVGLAFALKEEKISSIIFYYRTFQSIGVDFNNRYCKYFPFNILCKTHSFSEIRYRNR